MEQADLLRKVLEILESSRITYMLVGSIASGAYGEPRMTQDIDIVIGPAEKQLINFIESLGPDYYVSLEAARDAFTRSSMFNVIDNKYGWKADFIIRKERPFSLEEFDRKGLFKLKDMNVWR